MNQEYVYDPFGNTLAMSGPLSDVNKYRFSSKEWNDNSGMYYYLYRFYDPSLQRRPNGDPLTELGFELLQNDDNATLVGSLNLYAFVNNNTINQTDPDGRGVVDCLPAIGELEAATANVVARTAAIVTHGGHPDAGHKKALQQAVNRMKNAEELVAKHCACVVIGVAAALAAAEAAAEAAAPYLAVVAAA